MTFHSFVKETSKTYNPVSRYCSALLTILWILYLIAVIVAAAGALSIGKK